MTSNITRLLTAFLTAATLAFAIRADAQAFYKWVDDNGEVHFADSLAGVPAKYRNQVTEGKFKKKAEPSQEGPKPAGEQTPGEPSESQQKKLRRYEIPYTPYEGSARRIIIPVRFNNSVTANMALDTGAPGLVVSFELAEKLGLFDKDDGMLYTQAGGIGGSAPAMRTIIDTVQVGDAKDSFIPATITEKITKAFDGLVGMDFMSNFSVTINTRGHTLILEEIPATANRPGGHDEEWWRINFHDFAGTRSQWRKFADFMAEQERNKTIPGVSPSDIKQLKAFAEKQYSEADKLFSRLDRHAADNSVPMNWRKY